MTSRSVRRRLTRRRTDGARPVAPTGKPSLLVEVKGPLGVTQQSFLITPGESILLDLGGYEQDFRSGLRMITVPVTIHAQII